MRIRNWLSRNLVWKILIHRPEKDDVRNRSEVRELLSISSRTYWQKIVNFQTPSHVPQKTWKQLTQTNRYKKEIPNLTTWNLNLKNLIPWKTLLLLRCGRDSNPRPLAWQASILTNWTTAPKYSCLYFRINLYQFVVNRISHYVLRAENETRTRDPNLGKVVLYQLSYFRIISEEEETRTPTSQLTLPPQSSASTNSATSPIICCRTFLVVRAQNRTRTCTSWNTRTWNERVYHSATWA